jgi:hypothetical protein
MIPIYSKVLKSPFDSRYHKKLCSEIINRHKETIYVNSPFQLKDFLSILSYVSKNNKMFITNSNNFYLSNDYLLFTTYLHEELYTACKSIFGDFEPSKESHYQCGAYVSNNSDYRIQIHDHVKTSTVTGVYYLKVPSLDSGKLDFYDDNKNVIYSHQPVENELLIFPNYLSHAPQKSNSDDYRIAITVEFFVLGGWEVPKEYAVKVIHLN